MWDIVECWYFRLKMTSIADFRRKKNEMRILGLDDQAQDLGVNFAHWVQNRKLQNRQIVFFFFIFFIFLSFFITVNMANNIRIKSISANRITIFIKPTKTI